MNRINTPTFRTYWQAISNRTGSAAEAVVSVIMAIIVLGIISAGAVTNMGALSEGTANAERVAAINSYVGKTDQVPGWSDLADNTPPTAADQFEYHPDGNYLSTNHLLPSQRTAPVRFFAYRTGNGIEYIATIPRTTATETQAELCGQTEKLNHSVCFYATAFHTTRKLQQPDNVPNLTTATIPGTIPAGQQIASAPASGASTWWRFYLEANAVGAPGTIRVVQDSKTLANIPAPVTTTNPLFGTIQVNPAGGPVTFISYDRNVTVNKFYLYEAGVR